jgi:hypothetical protein
MISVSLVSKYKDIYCEMKQLIRHILREHTREIILEMPKKLTQDEFIEKAKTVHGDKYDYSETHYQNTRTKVKIICPTHGEFYQTADAHVNGQGCPKCKGGVKQTQDEFLNKAKSVHGKKYDYSKVNYKNSQIKIKIICPKHGEFLQLPGSHIIGYGCPMCAVEGGAKKRQLELSDFIKKSEKIHNNKYDYNKVVYRTNKDKVKIICPIHGEFLQKAGDHMKGVGCPKCAGQNRTTQEFIDLAKKKHNNKYGYSKTIYIDAKSPLKIICPIHGEFSQKAGDHMKGVGCPKCAGHGRTTEDFINLGKQIHNNYYDYSLVDYKSATGKVKIICPKHGLFLQQANAHLGGQGCPLCGVEKNTENKRRTTEEMISLARTVHGDKYDYSLVDYKRPHEKVTIICPTHGEFSQTMHSHINGSGCPTCNESKGEKLIAQILNTKGINFERQHKFIDCTNKIKGRYCKKLPFDFYIPTMNTCLEYDGEQHYRPVDAFGGEKSFQKRLESDSIKNQYCKKNGIKLIRIPYTMKKEKIEPYILKELGIN